MKKQIINTVVYFIFCYLSYSLLLSTALLAQNDTTFWHQQLEMMSDSLRPNPANALDQAYRIQPSVSSSSWTHGKARLLYMMGIAQVRVNQLDSGIHYYQAAIPLFESLNKKLEAARANYQLGRGISNQDRYEASLPYFATSLALFQEVSSDQDVMRCLISYAWVETQLGEYPSATQKLYEAIRLAEQLDEPRSIFNARHELGNIQLAQEDLKSAEESYRLNAALAESLDDPYKRSVAYGDLALYYTYAKVPEKALEYDLKDLHIQLELGNSADLPLVYNNVGADYLELGQPKEAITYIKKALEQEGQHRDEYNHALSQLMLGQAYQDLGQSQQAIDYLQRALSEAETLNNAQLIQDSRTLLVETYQKLGRYREAFEENSRLQLQKDSLYSLEKNRQITELEQQYETEKKEQQILLLRKDAEVSKFRQRSLLLTLLAVFLVGMVTIIAIIRGRRHDQLLFRQEQALATEKQKNSALENQQLQAQLTYKNQQLTAKVLQLCQKNELLQSLAQQVEGFPQTDDQEIRQSSRQMSNIIRQSLDSEADWEALLQTFTEVHPDFLQNLQTRYTTLSKSEMRLACLLRMNLSSKEISGLLNISHEGIKKARYRLRKKLELDTQDDLSVHLMSF
jgi:tetratricopeptide (TPR) repeat protein